jgi:radical SAM protein with 4Fe4S-binding SPASM domain
MEFNIKNRVLHHYDIAKRIMGVVSSSKKYKNTDLPLPKMAFIYPSYRCSLHCKNCMYIDHVMDYTKTGNLDMDLDLFKHILEDLSKMGVSNVELCGGGEPLEHKEINELIKVVGYFRKVKKMDFGLITNGQNISKLEPKIIKSALESFAYIRLSFSERTFQDQKLRVEYLSNLTMLLEYKKENKKYKARIGSKLLLTHENKYQLLEIIEELINMGVEHLKIKSIRSPLDEPTYEDVMEVEEQLNIYKYSKPVKEALKVDLRKTEFPNGFKCWINPLSTTIDPYGKIYICYNFHNDPDNMLIGKYNENNSLSDFWGKSEHLRKIRNINVNNVCKADTACNCRFVQYQKIIENRFNNKVMYIENDNSKDLKRLDYFL